MRRIIIVSTHLNSVILLFYISVVYDLVYGTEEEKEAAQRKRKKNREENAAQIAANDARKVRSIQFDLSVCDIQFDLSVGYCLRVCLPPL